MNFLILILNDEKARPINDSDDKMHIFFQAKRKEVSKCFSLNVISTISATVNAF